MQYDESACDHSGVSIELRFGKSRASWMCMASPCKATVRMLPVTLSFFAVRMTRHEILSLKYPPLVALISHLLRHINFAHASE